MVPERSAVGTVLEPRDAISRQRHGGVLRAEV